MVLGPPYLLDFPCFHGTICGRNHLQDHETLLPGAPFQQVGHRHCELLLGDALAGPLRRSRQVHPPHAVIQPGDHLWGKRLPNVAL